MAAETMPGGGNRPVQPPGDVSGSSERARNTWSGFKVLFQTSVERAAVGERAIGEQRRPRVLLLGDVPAGVAEVAEDLAPTVRSASGLRGIDLAEWDLLIGDHTRAPPDKHRIAFVTEHSNMRDFPSDVDHERIEHTGSFPSARGSVSIYTAESKTNTFFPPAEDLPTSLRRLIEATLIPTWRNSAERAWYVTSRLETFVPLASTTRGQHLAAMYTFSQDSPDALRVLLPADIPRPDEWVRALLLDVYRSIRPDTFAGLRDWSDDERWMTTGERTAAKSLERHHARRRQMIDELDRELADLEASVQSARDAARSGVGRLLSAQHSDLVEAVADALRAIGFDVELRDESDDAANRGTKREDLIVRDVDDSAWVSLSEVRGYTGGAAVGDLMRIERFTTAYVASHGSAPTRRWYIVNQFINESPSGRQPALSANAAELADFADNGGAVIDTRELFLLATALEDLTDEQRVDVRTRLRQATGLVTAEDVIE